MLGYVNKNRYFCSGKVCDIYFLTYNYEEIIVYGLSPVHGSGHDKLQEQ